MDAAGSSVPALQGAKLSWRFMITRPAKEGLWLLLATLKENAELSMWVHARKITRSVTRGAAPLSGWQVTSNGLPSSLADRLLPIS